MTDKKDCEHPDEAKVYRPAYGLWCKKCERFLKHYGLE